MSLSDYEKIQLAHTFRWLDHVQHLPDMFELVSQRNLFVTFPDEKNAQPPSKGQLKKLAKMQAAQEKKAQKKATDNKDNNNSNNPT